jgi:hypothetical protein
MVRTFKYAIPLLCILLLAAHFFRKTELFFLLVSVFGLPLLFMRRPMVMRIMQLFFILAGIEWARTTFALVMERKALGLPSLRMAVILGFVTLLTFGSTMLLNARDSR